VPELEQTFSVLRIVALIIAGTIGIYGLILTAMAMIIYLISFENFGAPLLAPFSPLITNDLKDTIYKGFIQEMQFRPYSLNNKNKRRIGDKKIKGGKF
jgi:spore germination protein KA